MNEMTDKRSIDEVVEALRSQEHVEKVTRFGDRVIVTLPRERGGRGVHTIPGAKALLARLESR